MRTFTAVSIRAIVALTCAGIVLLPGMAGASSDTITLVSGAGPVGTADPATQMSFDGGATFQPAVVIDPHPAYSVIPGTSYVSDISAGQDHEFTTTLFRTTFSLPSGFQDGSITVQVHADNAARVLLNGMQIGAQQDAEIFPNFQNPAETYTAAGPFVAGTNTVDFVLHNFQAPMGLDYKAVVTFTSNTPPSLDLPADITVNATGATGATVSYAVSASDLSDPSPDVTCTPTSGSTFPISTTTVTCTASDDDGLSTSGSFSVTVLGAHRQLDELLNAVHGVGRGNSLPAKVENAQAALVRVDTTAACAILAAFVNEVDAQSGKGMTTAQATQLISDATRIRVVLGCTS